MGCTSPLRAYRDPSGKVVISRRDAGARAAFPLKLACGQCRGCRLRRVQDWAVRATHESQLHEQNCFVTLTYDEEHLPEDHSVNVKHWQRFANKLRKKFGSFRYLHCGEYGDESLRPHYHACIFGIDFSESRIEWQNPKTPDQQLYISSDLAQLWEHGNHSIGQLNFDTAAYVAAYTFKRIDITDGTPDDQVEDLQARIDARWQRVDPTTGECWEVKRDYATMSLKPAIGKKWFDKYWKDVYPNDFAVANGRTFRPPVYYDKLLEQKDPDMHATILKRRGDHVLDQADDLTPDRLATKERLLLLRSRSRKRGQI